MKKLLSFGLIGMLMAGLAVSAQDAPVRFFRMEVTKMNDPDFLVKVRLPLTVIRSMVPIIETNIAEEVSLDGQLDLRQIWNEVRRIGPTDFVEINEKDHRVIVKTTKTHVIVENIEQGELEMQLRVPMVVLDALFADEAVLDFQAALDRLEMLDDPVLLSMESAEENIRIWLE